MTDAEAAAVTALREARQALTIGERAADAAETPSDHDNDVALEIARLLEATVHLVRTSDLEAVPVRGSNHRLHAVIQHLSSGAELARRTGRDDDGPATSHPEPRTAGPDD
ncbi:hypothetical protein [Actinomycetospora termitidis]|uniref:Uncharacterized protein n=1 Tax=Actinomycetospora termitidis TaxID=3053470 RepID=A0ABT7MHG5_9PSEU|nr:hypothetical protein [Actinomycetospora sp. Odt1-22]MDL5159881.1 hypothetical protein [Actinomycetospora sp. Odt1-22]